MCVLQQLTDLDLARVALLRAILEATTVGGRKMLEWRICVVCEHLLIAASSEQDAHNETRSEVMAFETHI